jgi:hypothetical protein
MVTFSSPSVLKMVWWRKRKWTHATRSLSAEKWKHRNDADAQKNQSGTFTAHESRKWDQTACESKTKQEPDSTTTARKRPSSNRKKPQIWRQQVWTTKANPKCERGKMGITNITQQDAKTNISLLLKQDYNKFTEVTILPRLFDVLEMKIVYGTLLLI